MRRFRLVVPFLAGLVCASGWFPPAAADPSAPERRIGHPNGAAIVVHAVTGRDDSIVLSARIANPTERELRLNRSRSFVLAEDGPAVHHLNPPLDNPELTIPPRAEVDAELVFIGPPAPGAREVRLSTNQGIGSPDNPYDDAPAMEATLPLTPGADQRIAGQASHPDGATLRVGRIAIGRDGCLARVAATNGNDRTIVLNQAGGLTLVDQRGTAAAAKPAAENRELVVPPGTRLDAALVFDCRRLDTAGPLTLATNRGTAGTPDNPYETVPVFQVRVEAEPAADGAAMPAASHASVAPIARSQLGLAARLAAAAPTAPPPAEAAPAAKPPKPSPQPPHPEPAAKPAASRPAAPKTAEALEAALHAEKTDRGWRLVVPSDALFEETGGALRPGDNPTLADLAAFIDRVEAREVVVIAHTDSRGSDDDNLALSEQRAHAVADWLKAHVTAKPAARFVEEFYGRTRPVAPNHKADGSDNPEGRAQNRRIEILVRRR